jgi:hypothetical protein
MDFGMMTGFIVEIFIIPFSIGLIPFEPQFCPKSNPNPSLCRGLVKAAVAELISSQAQQYYKELTSEFTACFSEGLLTLVAGTVYLGQLSRQYLYELELNARALPDIELPFEPPLVLSGFVPFGLLESNNHVAPNKRRRRSLEERMISVVDSSVINKPKPRTARSGQHHQCNSNIVFGIDSRTVKELRAMAKEQGYRNLSKLTKRELLRLLA